MSVMCFKYYPYSRWVNISHIIFLSFLGSIPHRYLFILLGEEKQCTVKCLAQGHKHHGRSQDSNPHSDDKAKIRCTKPLGHVTKMGCTLLDITQKETERI